MPDTNTITWEPLETNLITVKEDQNFTSSIVCYEDRTIGNQTRRIYFDIEIVPETLISTITVSTRNNPGFISGFYRGIFNDTLIFQKKDLNKDIINTLETEPSGESVWNKIENRTDILGITGFIPDPTRKRILNYVANAYEDNSLRSSKTYTITISDPNWDIGKENFRKLVQKYENE